MASPGANPPDDGADDAYLRDLFRLFAADDGLIHVAQLTATVGSVSNLPPEDLAIAVEELYSRLDKDGSGSIDFEEFRMFRNDAPGHFAQIFDASQLDAEDDLGSPVDGDPDSEDPHLSEFSRALSNIA
eukprot:CAMPEP_0206310866 /NCGR_PEP_ID=MMETSP0106_2-20121207/13153_1 /ASSEMBLY_ACC=CAM_ASM_000206 /TAXON_ID=81532 /ORGANISM="Acanthoeca-like sp., Strain 10tr" /LENGTH=128 /DNA_ID=CAMNT_0053742065 /DNA_START=66 /DNA_END=449 /DNA_ORIENTATION=+